jgi:hypothetical protein
MTDTIRNLDDIATQYTFFEQDQVLTPGQLNSVSEYLGDQERLTRVALIGVGIACGLRAALDGSEVVLSHGVGTTTDGDVVFLDEETRYDRYKPYDSTAPVYPPFIRGGKMITAYELVRTGESDARALVLTGFKAREGLALESMAAVLYVESFLRDDDLCTGTDCDNRGKESVHTLRLLLVERTSAAALAGAFDTPDGAGRKPLAPASIARAFVRGALTSEGALAGVYREACAKIHNELVEVLGALWAPSQFFLGDLADADPGPRWIKSLEVIRDQSKDRGIQYYYDFLKDVAETYNAFLDALFGDTAVCCPDRTAFPKHLVLGALDPAQRSPRERTGFYPSPMVSAAFEQRVRARFLLGKLDALIANFAPPVPAKEVRITPSAFEDRALEARAIPFYYKSKAVYPVWSYALSQRGREDYNLSYNADDYSSEDSVKNPLDYGIGRFSFFRIEGHVGRPLKDVKAELEKALGDANLPIDLEYVRLDKPPRGWRPPWRNPDLYRLHHLMRSEVATQIDEAQTYGDKFVARIAAASGKDITDADNNGVPLSTAGDRKKNMSTPMKVVAQKLTAEKYDPTWADTFGDAVQGAAELEQSFSAVTKKEFVSPVDQLVAGQPARWLGWLDVLVADVEDKEAERAQLLQFAQEHPGLEHYAGVARGGTFVVVCDASDTVVADFMLPYTCCQPRVEPPAPPKLTPLPRPDIVFEKPIRLVAFPDKFRFDNFKADFLSNFAKDVDVQKKYLDGVKDSVNIFLGGKAGNVGAGGFQTFPGGGTVGGTMTFPGGGTVPQAGGGFTLPGGGFTDTVLNIHTANTAIKAQMVDSIRLQLLDPQLDEVKRDTLEKQLGVAETELGNSIVTMTQYVADAKLDVKAGTEGAAAMQVASQSLGKVSNIDALAQVEKGLNTVGTQAATADEMKVVIAGVLGGRGMM